MPPNGPAPNVPASYNTQKSGNHTGLWIFLLTLTVLLFVAAASFGIWAYTSRQDYKDNVDKKIAAAVEIAKTQTSSEKDNEFVEKEKSPLKVYQGPSAYGAVLVKYPKTWGAYVDEKNSGNTAIDGYFHPVFVPGLQTQTAYALRVQVVNRSYNEELDQFDSRVKQSKVSVAPYAAPNVKNIKGARVTGEISNNIQGVMILLPLRDKTLKIWTEANQFVGDLDKQVLANLTFSP